MHLRPSRVAPGVLAALLSLSLVAASCSSDDDSSDTTVADTTAPTDDTTAAADTSAASAVDTTAAVTDTTASGDAPPGTDASAAGTFGKQADGTYLGKGDFRVDLANCPKDYDVHQGITDTEIKIFLSLPKSGPFAGFGLIADGMNSYFSSINDQGGIDGRKLVMDSKDDLYQADKTKANVSEAIASGDYALLTTTLGTPNNLAIWDDTNKECMPQLLNASGAAEWGDVDGHPWTTGMQVDYTTEAILWSEFVKKEFPDGAKVGMLTYNSDFGLSYSKGFRYATKDSNVEVVKEELHEASAPNLTNQFTNLMAAEPDVVLIQTSGAFCTQAMAELEKRSYKGKVVMSATCASLSQFFQPLIAQGLTGAGTYILQYVKDVNDTEFADDEFVKLFHETLKAQGLDDTQSTYATGWLFAWYQVEILKLAATYEGGLDRANIMLAARGIDAAMPLVLPGVTNKMDGMNDAYLNEASRVAQYKVTDPKKLGSFVAQGEVINKEGSLGTYKKFKDQTGG